MRPHKLIAKLDTPTGPSDQTTSSNRLPEALVSEQLRRLAMAAAVGAGLWAYGLVMDTLIRPLAAHVVIPRVNIVVELAAIAFSGLMFLYVRFAPHKPETKGDVGLLFIVANAIGVAILNNWSGKPALDVGSALSWNTVVILVSAMIIPSTPRKMLAASMVAASMDPFVVWVAHLRGLEVPTAVHTLVLFMPNYACAVVATLPSSVLHRLGQRLRHAQELGSYHLIELLGRGGMGEVWRGRHRLLSRNAAIKLVRPELLGAASDADAQNMLHRFEREAQATAALSSPHTVRLFDFGVTADQTFYYVMELLAGRDLKSLITEFGPLSAERAMFLLRQVCHSLADAHARGFVHRDITPSNIYVCRMGLEYDFVKVLDFGLVTSKERSAEDETMMAGSHTTTGTPAFMAPEVILEGDVDARTDVYAVGCVAYYILTGQLVFEADTTMKMFLQHVQAPPMPPSQRTELPIPRELDQLVLACLEKDPRRRPQNAQVLLRALDRMRPAQPWTTDCAKSWWEKHLVELTGPLSALAA